MRLHSCRQGLLRALSARHAVRRIPSSSCEIAAGTLLLAQVRRVQ